MKAAILFALGIICTSVQAQNTVCTELIQAIKDSQKRISEASVRVQPDISPTNEMLAQQMNLQAMIASKCSLNAVLPFEANAYITAASKCLALQRTDQGEAACNKKNWLSQQELIRQGK